ncbi:hypothetical protein TNCV_4645671 [Trichonephila clavipes]|nr:hypothetical protein TNCV_4645671 [Trichonephila clavipes]
MKRNIFISFVEKRTYHEASYLINMLRSSLSQQFTWFILETSRKELELHHSMIATGELRRVDRRGVTPQHLLFMALKIMRLRVRDSLTVAFKHGKNVNITRQELIEFLKRTLNLTINTDARERTTRYGTTIDAVFSRFLDQLLGCLESLENMVGVALYPIQAVKAFG